MSDSSDSEDATHTVPITLLDGDAPIHTCFSHCAEEQESHESWSDFESGDSMFCDSDSGEGGECHSLFCQFYDVPRKRQLTIQGSLSAKHNAWSVQIHEATTQTSVETLYSYIRYPALRFPTKAVQHSMQKMFDQCKRKERAKDAQANETRNSTQ